MGNRRMWGHMNLGAGRIVLSRFSKINKAVKEDSLKDEKAFERGFLLYCQKQQQPVHFVGLL